MAHQHVRRLDRAGRAGRAARGRDAREIEVHEQRLAVGAGYRDVEHVRCALRAVGVDDQVGDARARAGSPGRRAGRAAARPRPPAPRPRARPRARAPPRRPRSRCRDGCPYCWPPPWMIASTAFRSRTIRAPMPLGAPILWPEIVARVHATVARGRTAPCRRPAPRRCGTPRPPRSSDRRSRATGCTTPTSLLTHMTETTAGRSARAASSASRSTRPVACRPAGRPRARPGGRRRGPRPGSPCARWPRPPRTWRCPGPARPGRRRRCRGCRPRCRRR